MNITLARFLLERYVWKDRGVVRIPTDYYDQIMDALNEQEAVEPRVSRSEQRCGNCNKVIEMDGWKACPWCGKRIDWEGWWKKNGTRNQDT